MMAKNSSNVYGSQELFYYRLSGFFPDITGFLKQRPGRKKVVIR